jgi:hypothetical protein
MGKTSLFWRYNPRKTHITAEDTAPAHMKNFMEFSTVVACMSGINTHNMLQQARVRILGPLMRSKSLPPAS